MSDLPTGIYERLLDQELQDLLESSPELSPVLRAIDNETSPHTYSQFVAKLVQQALRMSQPEERVEIVNRVIEVLSTTKGLEFFKRKRLLSDDKNLLTEVTVTGSSLLRPETPIAISSLLTGQGADPPLEHELRTEMQTADRVDILVSFIKWSGLRLLMPAFENLRNSGIPVRILSTSYMGASDPTALEWLAKQPNINVRVSYDTGRTRLHAKAYHFIRKTGYSSAYIGSANMSHPAMTQGLEWTVKVTDQDMGHVIARFVAEFSSYWESGDFESFTEDSFERFRKAIASFRSRADGAPQFFAEITPRPFQIRILEALEAARQDNSFRNLVVAATGTGKTVISALDYKQTAEAIGKRLPLLFVVHRKEILQQALGCFRSVLRDQNFGELFVDGQEPIDWTHVFASVQSLNRKQPWLKLGSKHFEFVIVDEVHHGAAHTYRPLFDHLKPKFLLGLTATPERMDGSSILKDFGDKFAAEIRLPEALEEKLLCPFHYFGVTDSIDLNEERFWRNGRYDSTQIELVFTGDDIRAKERLDIILNALNRYQPDLENVRGVGFCAGVKHAEFMARHFNEVSINAAVLLGNTPREERAQRLRHFREGKLKFLFTVDVLSEGIDVPEINLVLFLRPTESLTIFLQQLGRGLRHARGKDCLTVLDFIGHTHRKYRVDTKFTALLSRRRKRIDHEIEMDFPNLPQGCSIQLERVAREKILTKIRTVLNNLDHFVPESIKTWKQDSDKPLTFGNFIKETRLSPCNILKKTWSEWKAIANQQPSPLDNDLIEGRKALRRLSLRTDPTLLSNICKMEEQYGNFDSKQASALHYLLWAKKGSSMGINSLDESMLRWLRNPSLVSDAKEISQWRSSTFSIPSKIIELPFPCELRLHAAYGSAEIKAFLGLSSLERPGPTGQGVMHSKAQKCYVHLVTFRKDERDFSPTTRYRDYPISRGKLHWESQSTITQESATGENYIHFKRLGYTILFFARLEKKIDGETAPFLFLGPAKSLKSYSGNRPISMVWELEYKIPAELFEEARAV